VTRRHREGSALVNVDAWNVGLITAHRPEVTPEENSLRMGELRTDIGGRFGVLEVRGRYVPQGGAEPIEERAFFLRGKANESGNLNGFLRKAGRKFDPDAVIWKGDGKNVVLFALKEWPSLGLGDGDVELRAVPDKSDCPVSCASGRGLRWIRSVGRPWCVDHAVVLQSTVQTGLHLIIKAGGPNG
jgi:hypothetical protein